MKLSLGSFGFMPYLFEPVLAVADILCHKIVCPTTFCLDNQYPNRFVIEPKIMPTYICSGAGHRRNTIPFGLKGTYFFTKL